MRHRVGHRKLQKTTSHRLAMLDNMVTSLLEHEAIRTTVPKAKEARRLAERIITLGKRGGLSNVRLAERSVRSRAVLQKVFGELKDRYASRPGRLHPHRAPGLPHRRRGGDGAPRAGGPPGEGRLREGREEGVGRRRQWSASAANRRSRSGHAQSFARWSPFCADQPRSVTAAGCPGATGRCLSGCGARCRWP